MERAPGLIGLKAIKESIKRLIDRLQLKYERELEEQPPVEVSLNVFLLAHLVQGKHQFVNCMGRY